PPDATTPALALLGPVASAIDAGVVECCDVAAGLLPGSTPWVPSASGLTVTPLHAVSRVRPAAAKPRQRRGRCQLRMRLRPPTQVSDTPAPVYGKPSLVWVKRRNRPGAPAV